MQIIKYNPHKRAEFSPIPTNVAADSSVVAHGIHRARLYTLRRVFEVNLAPCPFFSPQLSPGQAKQTSNRIATARPHFPLTPWGIMLGTSLVSASPSRYKK